MSDKWSELLGGAAENVKTPPQPAPGATFGSWAILLPLAIVAVIAVVVAGSGGNSKTIISPSKSLEPAVNVVQATAQPDYGTKAAIADSRGAPVGVRNTARQMFAQDDADLGGLQKPFADSEAGFSYSDFQRAMEHGRVMPEVDRAPPSNSDQALSHIASMKAFIKRNGMTVEEFSEARDSFLPETIVDSWDTEPRQVLRQPVQETTEDSLMLAREALQFVPTEAPESAIVPVLREILAARTEAAASGIAIPSVTDDQRHALKGWSSRGGTAGSLASSILSRS